MRKLVRTTLLTILVVAVIAVCLSSVFDVPYVITFLGLSAWAALGHLITLDDDVPGEWSNPEGSMRLWRLSLLGLAIKVVVVICLFMLIARFPQIREFGA